MGLNTPVTPPQKGSPSVDLAALYDELQSIRAVAERTGLPYSNVRRQLHRAGVKLRPSGGRPLDLDADPVADYLAGLYRRDLSLRAIKARTGYGYGFIRARVGPELRDRQGRPRKAAGL
ncbi:helix-turn-helix domain-containing protein [Streptomyces sp. NPDC005989]|uniref:helix-turn-helix domain-containing protein n=1 Tax=Streptomyces sp. NPDC005989 TaxID=3156727 RepID=UPI0033E7655A